jgi:hypothetical protein
MGFFPSETVNLRIYFTEIPGEADYVASRAIQVDKDGAALIEITVARSATFSIAGILVTVDGDNSPHLTPVASSIADNTLVASRPTNATDFRQYKSLWNGVNFKDMTSPGSQNYETSIDAKTVRSFSFTWCGDSPTRLQEIVAPLSVSFSIDDAKVPDSSILVLDEGNCRKWATILNGWKPGSTVALQIRYTLSKVIFDGTANYAAGDYVHQLKVHVR